MECAQFAEKKPQQGLSSTKSRPIAQNAKRAIEADAEQSGEGAKKSPRNAKKIENIDDSFE